MLTLWLVLILQTSASIKAKVMAYISAVQAKEASASGTASPGLSAIDPDGERGGAAPSTTATGSAPAAEDASK